MMGMGSRDSRLTAKDMEDSWQGRCLIWKSLISGTVTY